jgi:glycosyltransferase involved in cell wall biosynthesis
MQITYFYRHPRCGFSIQRVFQTITDEIRKQTKIKELFLPVAKADILAIFKNGRFARKNQTKNSINHITGAEHYLLYFLQSRKTVVTVHDIMYYSYLSGIKKKIWKLIYIDSLKRAERVVFISDFAKKQVTDIIRLSDDKVCVIPDAVSKDYLYSPKNFNQEKPIILHIGTLERKNLSRTILSLKNIECHLRIVGKLNSETIALLKENNIEYSNVFNLTDEEIVKEYQDCDIVNFPSTFEGFGMPIIEGQATGRIVITSNISPMKEVAGEAAVLVDPLNTESMREGYLKIIQDDAFRDKLIQKGLNNVKLFTVESVAKCYMNVYNDIASK